MLTRAKAKKLAESERLAAAAESFKKDGKRKQASSQRRNKVIRPNDLGSEQGCSSSSSTSSLSVNEVNQTAQNNALIGEETSNESTLDAESMQLLPLSNHSGLEGNQEEDYTAQVLQNHLFLEKIFSHLQSVEDLKQIRLVCKQWYTLTLQRFRSLATLRLGQPGRVKHPLIKRPYDIIPPERPIDNFCHHFLDPNDVEQLAAYPFEKFTFRGIEFERCPLLSYCDNDNNGDNFNFWNDIGPHVTSLRFIDCAFYREGHLVLEKIIGQKLPKLVTLQISYCRLPTDTAPPPSFLDCVNKYKVDCIRSYSLKNIFVQGKLPIPICIDRLLLNSPNLESLRTESNALTFIALLRVCNFKTQLDGSTFPLKSLDVILNGDFFCLPINVFRRWTSTKLKLEQLHITICNGGNGVLDTNFTLGKDNDFQNLLQPTLAYHADTLKVLKVFRPPVFKLSPKCPFTIPMLSLRELYLYGNIVRTLDFLVHMPNLHTFSINFHCFAQIEVMRRLYVNKYGFIMPEKIQEDLQPFLQARETLVKESRENIFLAEMKRLHVYLELDPLSFETIAGWMPRLVILKTILTNPGFRMVCKWLPNLKELVLLIGSRIDDDGVTGLEDEKTGRIPENITALTKLHKFELRDNCGYCKEFSPVESPHIGEKSIYEGFLKMTSLEYINISVNHDVTDTAILALQNHVPNVTLQRIGEEDRSTNSFSKCCKLTFTKSLIWGLDDGVIYPY